MRERLVHFAHFRLHHELHVHRDLAERSADQTQEAADLGDVVAHRVPCNGRLAQPELRHQAGLRFECAAFDRGERAGGAGELADQDARAQLVEPVAMPLDRGQQAAIL